MSTEETKERPEREKEIPIPLYFDRYVASELRALGQRITDLKGIMDERFAHMDKRFVRIDERITDLKETMDERFVALKVNIEERFAQVDRRFEEVNQRLDKLESTLKWASGLLAGLFVPVIVGILAIIIKMFFQT